MRMENHADGMGTTFSIVLYGGDSGEMEAAVDAAFNELHRLEMMLSPFQAESEVARLNREAFERDVKISPELFQLLSACIEYSRRSEGTFDITVGSLVRAWGFFREATEPPGPSDVERVRASVGYAHIGMNYQAGTVRFAVPGLEINPGGFGKGYAVDRMTQVLRCRGFDNALISGSCSSIYGMGAPPTSPGGWMVDIRDPKSPQRSVETAVLRDMSISVSGILERSFYDDNRIYSHILNPLTGYPAPGMLQVAVVAQKTVDSEAWTKPCFINGADWAAKRKPAGLRVFFCPDAPGQASFWLD